MTDQRIFTPRACLNQALRNPHSANPCMCTKIPYHGYTISISMDSSHGPGDLVRSDIRIYDEHDVDVTEHLMEDYGGVVPATAESLKEAFTVIEEMALQPA